MFTKREIAEMMVQEAQPERQQYYIEYFLTFSDEKLSDKFYENCGARLQRASSNLFIVKY